jgi:hypothetical protein
MPRVKQPSKRKRGMTAVPVFGAAGLSLLAGGASAVTNGPAADMPTTPNTYRVNKSLSVTRNSPTSACRRFMSSTRKTLEISGPTYSLREAAAEAVVAEAAEAAPEVAAEAVDAGACRPEAVASARVEHLPITLIDAGRHGWV